MKVLREIIESIDSEGHIERESDSERLRERGGGGEREEERIREQQTEKEIKRGDGRLSSSL